MSETLLELNKLTKTFGNKKVVRGLSLKLHAGEIYGFLGPNGAGKTTTIRMIMDFIRPTSGAVTLFGGKGANQLAEKKQDIGYLSADKAIVQGQLSLQSILVFISLSIISLLIGYAVFIKRDISV